LSYFKNLEKEASEPLLPLFKHSTKEEGKAQNAGVTKTNVLWGGNQSRETDEF